MSIDWKARIAAAKDAAAAEKAKISKDDQDEIDARVELARIDAEKADAAKTMRDLDLARRLEKAREAHGDRVAAVAIADSEDTFIIRRDTKAHDRWEKDLGDSAQNKKLDRGQIARAYAVALVIDWNGETDFDSSENANKLINHLKSNAAATPIVNAGAKLAGFFAEESKS